MIPPISRLQNAIIHGRLSEVIEEMLTIAASASNRKLRDELILHLSECHDIDRAERERVENPDSVYRRRKILTAALIQLLNLLFPGGAEKDVAEAGVSTAQNLPFIDTSGHRSRPSIPAAERTKIFISYSHQDAVWLEHVRVSLKPYVRGSLLSCWDDANIEKGENWRGAIAMALSSAKAAVLLVSRYFLASDFIASYELPIILEASDRGDLKVLWIAVSASAYKLSKIEKYQCINNPAIPLDTLNPGQLNEALVSIAEFVARAVI